MLGLGHTDSREQRREIVGKHVGAGIVRITVPYGTRISGTEVALGVIGRTIFDLRGMLTSLPRSFGPMG